jgi:hypothetical protein
MTIDRLVQQQVGPAADSRPSAQRSSPPLSRWDRLAAASGAAFVVAILSGNSLTESVVGADPTPAGTARDLMSQGGSAAARLGLAIELVGLLCLAVFAAGVIALGLRESALRASHVLVGLGAGLVLGVKLASAAPYLAALHGAETLSVGVLHGLVETNEAAFVLTWLPFSLLLASLAVMLRRTGLVGRGLAGVGVVLGVTGLPAGLVGAVLPAYAVPVPFLLGVLWIGVVGLRIATRRVPAVGPST